MPNIFMSSTFKDLTAERDFIKNEVGAKLSAYTLKKYGENYDFTDLRLGVENVTGFFQTINMCLFHLKKAAPPNPYVVIIGDSLGQVTDKETLEESVKHLPDEDADIKTVLEKGFGKSITNIEIDYGAYGMGDPENSEKYKNRTLFIFKSEETPTDEPGLKDFKEKIKADFKDQIIYMEKYGDSPLDNDEFEKAVLQKLKLIIDRANENIKLSDDEKERKLHENYMELKASGFYGREKVIQEIKESINKNNGYTYIYGPSGIGKSSLISKIAKDYKKEDSLDVFPIYCSLTINSDSAFNVISAITRYLKKAVSDSKAVGDSSAFDEDNILDEYKYMCYLYEKSPETKPVLIAIDAIDQLKPDKYKDECAFLSFNGHEKIRFLFSGTDDGDTIERNYKQFRTLDEKQNFYLHEIKGIAPNEKKGLLKSIFANELNKGELPEIVVTELNKLEISSPFYFKLIALRIASFSEKEWERLKNTKGQRAQRYLEIVNEFLDSKEEGDIIEGFVKKLSSNTEDAQKLLNCAEDEAFEPRYPETVQAVLNVGGDRAYIAQLLEKCSGISDNMKKALYGTGVSDGDEKSERWLHDFSVLNSYGIDDFTELELLVKAFLRAVCENDADLYSVLQYIAMSQHGLPKSMLKRILGENFNEIKFGVLQSNLRNIFFEHRDGCIDFTHKVFRNALRKEIKNNDSLVGKVSERLERQSKKKKELSEKFFEALSGGIKSARAYHKDIFNALEKEQVHLDFVKSEFAYHAIMINADRELNRYIRDNTPRKNDSDEEKAKKNEALDFVAKTFVLFENHEIIDLNKGELIKAKTTLDFCFDKGRKAYSLSLADMTKYYELIGQICYGYVHKVLQNFKPDYLIENKTDSAENVMCVKIDEDLLKALYKYLRELLYFYNKVKLFDDFIYSRRHQVNFDVNVSSDVGKLWQELCTSHVFVAVLSTCEDFISKYFISDMPETNGLYSLVCKAIDYKENCFAIECYTDLDKGKELKGKTLKLVDKLVALYYADKIDSYNDDSLSENKKFNLAELENLKRLVAEEKTSPEEVVIYYNERMESFFNSVKPELLQNEYEVALSFLGDFMQHYGFHNKACITINNYLKYSECNIQTEIFESKYLCEKYIDIANLFMKFYKDKKMKPDSLKEIAIFKDISPVCFENEPILKKQWIDICCKYIKITYVDSLSFTSYIIADPINKLTESLNEIEKTAKLFVEQGYENSAEKLYGYVLPVVDKLFCHYEEHYFSADRVFERIVLPSLNDDGVGKHLNIATLYKNLTEKEKRYIIGSFESLLEYKEEFDRIRDKELEERIDYKKQTKWHWNRPKFDS